MMKKALFIFILSAALFGCTLPPGTIRGAPHTLSDWSQFTGEKVVSERVVPSDEGSGSSRNMIEFRRGEKENEKRFFRVF